MEKYAVLAFLIVATTLEATGDAVIRIGLSQSALPVRYAMFLGAAVLLFGYGLSLNLAPIEFERVVGLYIATLFIVWQIITFVTFRTIPSPSVLVGGALIVIGGVIVTYWRR